MAQTNVQAFSGDVEISSNLTAANSKFSLDTNGTLKQVFGGGNGKYIKLMKYFPSGSNWKIATGSYTGSSWQWLSIRAKMTRLDVDVKTIQFNYFGFNGTSRVRDTIVIGGGGSSTQPNEIKVYNKESNSTYEIYLQIDSATSVEVEITHRDSTIDDDYSTVATANNGAIVETGLTKIYDSGTTTDLRLRSGNVGIGTTNPIQKLDFGDLGGASIRLGRDHDDDTTSTNRIGRSGVGNNIWYASVNFIDENTNDDAVSFNTHENGIGALEKMRISGNGNVGIGTTNPQQKLEIHGNILLGQNDVDSFIHSGGNMAMSSDSGVLIVSDANDITGGSDADVIFGSGSAINMDASRDFTYAQAYPTGRPRVEHMRILGSNGNVGIGVTGSNAKLQVASDARDSSDAVNNVNQIRIDCNSSLSYAGTGGGITFCQRYWSGSGAMIATGGIFGARLGGTNGSYGGGLVFKYNPGATMAVGMVLNKNGDVGIGTTSPGVKLHVRADQTDLLYLQKTTARDGAGIKFTDDAAALQHGYLRYYHADTQSFGTGNSFRFSTTEETEAVIIGGSLQIGIDGKDNGAAGNHRKNFFIQSTYGGNTSQNYGWWMGAQNETLRSDDNDFYFSVVRNGAIKECGAISDQFSANMNFTGQHRTFVKDTPTSQLVDKEGLIVSADQNEFVKMSGGVVCGNEAITVNESLPLVSLSTKSNDKKCFGVLSTTEDPETRKEVYGNFASNMRKEEGDTRVYVNSVGEGAIWVVNINGTLESGDYITTSNVVGYGMKQDDDILHNYTVAKILMDCDFNPVTQPKRTIRKESRMIDYWIRYGDVKITEEEYQTLPETNRKIVEDVHYRIDQMEVVKENPEKDTFVYEQREDMVNVLDEHGEFQWEDSSETEKAYKIRYLDADGNITDEANAVHKAAFVGCTYHCG